jgi:hypothetical protein
MNKLTHQLFFWSEMVHHLDPLDFYIFSLANKELSMGFVKHVLPIVVFKVENLSHRRAWSILRMIQPSQLDSSSVRQIELTATPGRAHDGAYEILTTAADWAARKGYVELLEYLLVVKKDSCTKYAMDWAARNGHMDALLFLKDRGEDCTHAAADWAAARGQDRVLEWLYSNTHARCSELGPMQAAGMGFMRVLVFLHEKDPSVFRDTTANFALDNGHERVSTWLTSIGCHPSRKIRKPTVEYTTLYEQWD